MDLIDKKILNLLQQDSSFTTAEIADRVGLSSTPCWRRIQQMQDAGIIRRQVVLADAEKLNLDLTVMVAIRTSQHNPEWLEAFADAVSDYPQITEVFRMSGDIDYLLKVMVPDMKAYDAFYRDLIGRVDFLDISSSFAMEQIKYTTALPTDYC